jgi:hypothetical protein
MALLELHVVLSKISRTVQTKDVLILLLDWLGRWVVFLVLLSVDGAWIHYLHLASVIINKLSFGVHSYRTEHPVENLPRLFGNSQLYASFPYLLPCTIAATVTGTGCVLSLFLSYDAGPREGGIRLPEEKDVERAVHQVASLPGSVKKRVSGYFGSNASLNAEQAHEITDSPAQTSASVRNGGILGGADRRGSAAPRPRTSFAIPQRGSAYGYDPRRRDTALSRFRKMSTATSTKYAPDFEDFDYEPAPLNFAQK